MLGIRIPSRIYIPILIMISEALDGCLSETRMTLFPQVEPAAVYCMMIDLSQAKVSQSVVSAYLERNLSSDPSNRTITIVVKLTACSLVSAQNIRKMLKPKRRTPSWRAEPTPTSCWPPACWCSSALLPFSSWQNPQQNSFRGSQRDNSFTNSPLGRQFLRGALLLQ